MNIRYLLLGATCLGLGFCAIGRAQTAPAISTTRSLVISIPATPVPADKAAGKALDKPAAAPAPSPAMECVVTCGTALPLAAVAFSPDGKTLAVGGYQEVLLWDLAGGKLAKRIGAGQIENMVRAVVFAKDGRSLAVADDVPQGPGAVKLFNVETGQPVASLQGPKQSIRCLALSPDGKFLAAGSADTMAYVWNLPEKKLAATLKEHSNWVLSVCFSLDGKSLVTAGADKSWRIWEVGTWKPLAFRLMQDDPIRRCVFYNPEGSLVALAIGGHNEHTVRFRHKEWGNSHEFKMLAMGGMPLDLVWLFPPGSPAWAPGRICVACSDKTVEVFDLGDRNLTHCELAATLEGHGDWVYALAASADTTRLASASGDGTVKLWNLADYSLLATLVQLAPQSDQWLFVTGQGYFDTSTPAAVQWKTPVGKAAAEKLAGLRNPEKVRQFMAGKKNPPRK